MKSPALLYIWEAGNTERHDLDGSADRVGGGVVLRSARVGEPMIIHGLKMIDGILSADAAFNVHAELTPSQLVLKPVTTRKGNVVAPPDGAAVEDLLKAGQGHLDELSRIIFPRF